MSVRSNYPGGPALGPKNCYRPDKTYDMVAASFAKDHGISKRQARKVLQGRKTLDEAKNA